MFKHPSVVASAGGLVVLAAVDAFGNTPVWAWAAWAALTAVAVSQAVRSRA